MSARERMSRSEAGRKGGESTKAKLGVEHFQRIGKLGGRKGGETTKARYGRNHFKRIGQMGGSSEGKRDDGGTR